MHTSLSLKNNLQKIATLNKPLFKKYGTFMSQFYFYGFWQVSMANARMQSMTSDWIVPDVTLEYFLAYLIGQATFAGGPNCIHHFWPKSKILYFV